MLHLSQRPVLVGAAALALACVLSPLASAQQERRTVTDTKEDSKDIPIPKEDTAVTQHEVTVGGRAIHYTATAGNLLITKEDHDQLDKPYHSVFYVAYTEDGADAKTRPVTFLYNGGPGSATNCAVTARSTP